MRRQSPCRACGHLRQMQSPAAANTQRTSTRVAQGTERRASRTAQRHPCDPAGSWCPAANAARHTSQRRAAALPLLSRSCCCQVLRQPACT